MKIVTIFLYSIPTKINEQQELRSACKEDPWNSFAEKSICPTK